MKYAYYLISAVIPFGWYLIIMYSKLELFISLMFGIVFTFICHIHGRLAENKNKQRWYLN